MGLLGELPGDLMDSTSAIVVVRGWDGVEAGGADRDARSLCSVVGRGREGWVRKEMGGGLEQASRRAHASSVSGGKEGSCLLWQKRRRPAAEEVMGEGWRA